jgi:hypothetical protein
MTEEEFAAGAAAAARVYPQARLLPSSGTLRPLRVAPVPIPREFWGGGETRALIIFDLASHASARPRGLLGPEWRLPNGGAPYNASSVFEYGETWQAYSWAFRWPPPLDVIATIEAYLGRFSDHR